MFGFLIGFSTVFGIGYYYLIMDYQVSIPLYISIVIKKRKFIKHLFIINKYIDI